VPIARGGTCHPIILRDLLLDGGSSGRWQFSCTA
jgi:hypothetical protein